MQKNQVDNLMSEENITIDQINILKSRANDIFQLFNSLTGSAIIFIKPTPDNLAAGAILLRLIFLRQSDGAHVTYYLPSKAEMDEFKSNYKKMWFIGWPTDELKEILSPNKKDNNNIFITNNSLKNSYEQYKEEIGVNTFSLTDAKLAHNTLSTAGLVYFIARNVVEDYQKFSPLAVLGALYLDQFNWKKKELIGVNRFILNEGIDAGIIKQTKGTKIRGKRTIPIHLALKYSIRPFLPTLTGNEEACTSFLSKIGIKMMDDKNNWRTISDLNKDEIGTLNSELMLLISKRRNSLNDLKRLIGPIFLVVNDKPEISDIEELLQLVEGSCEMHRYGVGLAVLMGDRELHYNKLIKIADSYFGEATKVINKLQSYETIGEEHRYYKLIDGNKLVSKEEPEHIFRALSKANIIQADKPLLFTYKTNNKSYIFVYESKEQQLRGYSFYHIFEKILEEKDLFKLENYDENFVKLSFEPSKEKEILNELEERLNYHYTGKKGEGRNE